MKCPYRQSALLQTEQTSHDLVDEETGVSKGHTTVTKVIYEYCDCLEDGCAVWRDGECHYNSW